MRLIVLFTLLSFNFSGFSQNIFQGKKITNKSSNAILSEHFKGYDLFEIPTDQIFSLMKKADDESLLTLKLGKKYEWNLSLFPNDMRSANYQVKTATNQIVPKSVNKAFKGYESKGGKVRMTIDEDFLYGYVEVKGERYFVEPAWYLDKSAPKNQFVVYEEHNVIPNKDATCAADEMHDHGQDIPKSEPNLMKVTGLCYDVELAIASDYLMFQEYGSIAAVENHNIGVMNNVQGNYDDEFDDELNFVIVTQFVSNCSTCDPWTNSTSAGTLLSSFRSWGNSGGFGVTYDIAQLWTDRNLNGSTVGIAYLSGVCNNNRYHVCQDYTTTAWALRVLTAHEMGHNFSAGHDAPGAGTIMAPSVNNSNTWSAASISSIDNFVDGLNCLSLCASQGPPNPLFTSNVQNICDGSSVQFFDQSSGVVTSRAWTFTGGTPGTSSDSNPIVNYAVAGSYPVSLTVTNSVGSNTLTQSGYITVGPGGTNVILYDAFEDGLGNWTIENPNGNMTWASTAVGGTNLGNTAVFMNNWDLNGQGQRDGLISQSMDFSGISTVTLNMDYAYALWSGNLNFKDSLIIKISTDGGVTFPNTVFEGGDDGTGNFSTTAPQGELIPATTAAWCYAGTYGASCLSVDLSAFVGQTNVVMKIENVNGYGNNLYVDNVMVSSDCQLLLPPDTDFSGTPSSGCVPLTVQYTDISQNSPTSWNWSFPGGNPSSSTAQNPTVVYTTAGNYDVTLVTSNSVGSDTEFKSGFIQASDEPIPDFTFSVNGLQVNFTNQTTGGATTYNWLFGDGNSSNQENPVHTYATDGTYQVSLITSNQCGVVTTVQNVAVYTVPSASFSANPTTGCASLTVQFTDQSTPNTINWDWSFPGGNPSSSTVQNPSVTYDNPGVYSVTLTVSNSAGNNSFTQTDYITVNAGPTAGFSQNTNGLSVDFTNTSTNATSYSWDFGDGNSSSDVNPTHTYAMDGTYTVVLTSTNDCGSVTATETITIITPPSAGFGADITSGCAPLFVQFTDQSSSNATGWNWSFPGGVPNSSTEQNPLVIYTVAGNYTVTLQVTNAAGENTVTQTNYISVDDVPVAGFSQNTNGLSVDFTNTSTNATSYSWDFGDGNSSSDVNPTHQYSMDGTYDVVLTATNNCGSVTTTQTITIATAPTAGFGVSGTSGCAPFTVQFTDQSSSNTTGWNWSFPGGDPSSSTAQNPTVTYNTAGVYSVTLQVTNSAGENTVTQTDIIVVDDVPMVGFSQNTNGLSVDFTNTSTNATSYSWDFGDGNSSSDTNPTHTYSMDGNYEVVLTATNGCGSVTTMTTVTIATAPTAGFGVSGTSGCAPFTVQFTDQSSSNTTAWNWSFPGGDPSSSTAQNPTVTYNTAGVYSVTLQVTNSVGENTVTQTDIIVVDDVPVAGFSQNTNGLSVDFTNTSTNATAYSWDFGDGNSSSESNPTHQYSMDGVYDVVLTATNNCGSVTTTQTITIATAPTAGFGLSGTSGCAPFTVQFTDQSSANTTAWNWSFPGGNPSSSTAQNPTVTYNTAGVYSVTLQVTNSVGENTVTQTDIIIVDDVPVVGFSQNTNGLSVDFTNTSTNATSYSWDFGDGNSSSDTNPTHTYSMDGSYEVVLTATNGCGSVTTMTTVTVITAPTAGFGVSGTSGCAPLTVQFTDQSSANTTAWNWSFPGGNPSSSTVQNPTVTYNTAGVYSVTLQVTNAAGENTVTQTDIIVVDDVPMAGFSPDVNTYSVDFTNTSTNATSYSWDFGDGNSSLESNPTHTYANDGTYDVVLTATNGCGSVTTTQTLTIANTPTAGYTSGPTSGCAPFQVQFTDQSSNNTTGWEWSFPGGTPSSSTAQNPLVVYNTAGVYSVTLIASNAQGTDMITLTDYVTVDDTPMVDFNTTVNGPLVDFENQSSNANSYSWDFGDGNSSTEVNPAHQYSLNGEYTVILSATNDCGTTVFTQMVSITSSVIAGFTSDVVSGCEPLVVQFNDQSTNATSYLWTFTGGNPANSTLQNPLVTYENPGVYTVMLEAINSTGSSSITETGYIVVESLPAAGFTSSVNGLTVDFSNVSTYGETYSWDFGDGNMSAEENPAHTYAAIGIYSVTLMVTNDCGTSEITIDLDVGTQVTAGFSSENTEGCAPQEIQFLDQSSNNVSSWNWTFQGGFPANSNNQNPVVTYSSPGIYTVTLEVSNPWNSETITETNYITILGPPTANFSSSGNGAVYNFTNTSTNATTYMWMFGDGNMSTEENPSHTYATDGTFNVILQATNDCGTVTSEQSITVVSAVSAGFSADITEGCAGLTVQFTDASSSNVTNWNWTFPGGTPSSSTEQNPVVVYNTPGFFEVTLEVSNAGFSATQTETNYINILSPPTVSFTSNVAGGGVVNFNNTSTNATSYSWDFGDGGMSNEEFPSHTYLNEGTYTVILTATNACGSATTEVEVSVSLVPVAAFSIENLFDCAPATIQFIDESSANTTSWFWEFDGGSPSTSTIQNPGITFNEPGVHLITLTVTNASGSSMTSMEITLNGAPVVDFTSSVNILTTTFTNLSTNATSYLWDFGDGASSTEENPIHNYVQGGNYTVILHATNDCGTTTFTQQVEVIGPEAVATFSSNATEGCVPFTVNFTDTSTGNPTSWLWEFPGGTPTMSTDQNPTVVYNSAGTFDVTLTVTNPAGESTNTQTSYIIVDEAPTGDFTPSIDVDGTVTFTNGSTNGTSYSWDFGDGNGSNEVSPIHTYDSSGIYTVVLIAMNGCGSDTISKDVLVEVTSLEDLVFLEKLELYPNPNDGQFILNIEGTSQDELEIRFFNILGQQVFEERVDFLSGKYLKTYDFRNLPAATYILQIRSDNQLVHRKVVKE